MSMFDSIMDKAAGVVDGQGERIGEGLDKAGELVDEKIGGEHADQVAQGVSAAKDALDGLDGQDDDIP